MPHIDHETYEQWFRSWDWIQRHDATLRAALEQRRDNFVEAAREAMAGYKAGAFKEDPPDDGTILLMTHNGLKQAAQLFQEQAQNCVKALKALNRVTGDDYVYEIDWDYILGNTEEEKK